MYNSRTARSNELEPLFLALSLHSPTSNVLLVGRNPSLSVVSRNEMAAAQSSRRQQHSVAAAKHSTSGSTPAAIFSKGGYIAHGSGGHDWPISPARARARQRWGHRRRGRRRRRRRRTAT